MKAENLKERVGKLQSVLYAYASELEQQAERTKSPTKKEKLLKAAEAVTEAGFELDVSEMKMRLAVNTLKA